VSDDESSILIHDKDVLYCEPAIGCQDLPARLTVQHSSGKEILLQGHTFQYHDGDTYAVISSAI